MATCALESAYRIVAMGDSGGGLLTLLFFVGAFGFITAEASNPACPIAAFVVRSCLLRGSVPPKQRYILCGLCSVIESVVLASATWLSQSPYNRTGIGGFMLIIPMLLLVIPTLTLAGYALRRALGTRQGVSRRAVVKLVLATAANSLAFGVLGYLGVLLIAAQ